jgi:hypothetical protein
MGVRMEMSSEDLKMLRDFNSWNEGKTADARISIFDYLCFNASPDLLFGFASLFFCELIRVDGHYFIRERFDEEVYREWKAGNYEVRFIQKMMNHIHMRSLFQKEQLSDALALSCAQMIRDIWNKVFSDKSLVAEIDGESSEDISVTLVAAP